MLITMNKALSISMLLACLLSSLVSKAQDPFITIWKTDNSGSSEDTQITIPIDDTYSYNYDIYWEDISNSSTNGTLSDQTGPVTITFPSAGEYRVEISGDFPTIRFSYGGDRRKLLTIEQWGDISWSSMNNAFAGCENLTYNATDKPDLSNATDLRNMFAFCPSFNGAIGDWDVSTITSMRRMFGEASTFDQDLSNWNTGLVTDMAEMFQNASNFNGDVSTWNVSNVVTMSYMFYNTEKFNQDLSGWDVSKVQHTNRMFSSATEFNGDITTWNVGSVTFMEAMFAGASKFNQDIGGWNVSEVTDMDYMFDGASVFNQDLSQWNVSKVTKMERMFAGAIEFNGDISTWDMDQVDMMESMFYNAGSFNQNIGNWDVTGTQSLNRLFYLASSFNQDIGSWDVSNAIDLGNMFSGAKSFNQDISGWNVSNVTNMNSMFYDAIVFNQDLSNWDVSKVTDMYILFYRANAFDQNLGTWDIGSVTEMTAMFEQTSLSASNYDQTLAGWAALDVLQSDVPFGAAGIKYCDETNRQTLIDTYNWSITDGGKSGPIADVSELPELTIQCNGYTPATPTATGCDGIEVDGVSNRAFPLESSTTITWTYTDADDRETTQYQYVTIEDTTGPEPDQETLEGLSGECELAEPTAPTATDNCDAGAITATTETIFPLTESTTITWTFTDASGNESTQEQEVTIADKTAPVPDAENLADVIGTCEVSKPTAPTATDNCDGQISATTENTFPITESSTIIWKFTDTSGNVSTQDQEVVIECNVLDVTSSEIIQIYPNPVQEQLVVSGLTRGNIFLYSLSGEHVMSRSIAYSKALDLSNLNAGIYIVKITGEGIFKEFKLVKK